MSESNTAEEAASEEAPTAQSAGGFHGRSSVPGRRQYGTRRTGG